MRSFNETYSVWAAGEGSPRQTNLGWQRALAVAREVSYREKIETRVFEGWDTPIATRPDGVRFNARGFQIS